MARRTLGRGESAFETSEKDEGSHEDRLRTDLRSIVDLERGGGSIRNAVFEYGASCRTPTWLMKLAR